MSKTPRIVTQIKARQGVFGEGFSFVVGNPPYVHTESITSQYKRRLAHDYRDIYEGRFDLYIFFLGLGMSLLNRRGGKLGFIVPGKFLVTENGGKLRQYILDTVTIRQMVDISQSKVFKDVGNYPVIAIFETNDDAQARDSNQIKVVRWLCESIDGLSGLAPGKSEEGRAYQDYHIRQGRFASNFDKVFDIASTDETYTLREAMAADCVPLGAILETHQGIITGKKAAGDTARRKNIISASDMLSLTPDRTALCKKVVDGKNMPERYAMDWRTEYLIYAPDELAAPREPRWFETEKLIIKCISKRPTATYDIENFYCLNTLYVGLLRDPAYNLKYILSILNSKLMDFYYKTAFGAVHIGSNYLEYRTRYLDNLPIKSASQARKTELVNLVDNILEVNKQLPEVEAELADFPGMVSRLGISLIPLSASSGLVAVNLAPVQAIPKLALDGTRISLGSRSAVETADTRYARYLWLYVSALKDDLRGKTPSEIVELIQVPNSSDEVEMVLAKRTSIEDQLANLRNRRLEIDGQIDSTVNELYGLTPEEIGVVEGSSDE